MTDRPAIDEPLPMTLARALVLRRHGIGIYSKIGYLEEIEQGQLRYITIR